MYHHSHIQQNIFWHMASSLSPSVCRSVPHLHSHGFCVICIEKVLAHADNIVWEQWTGDQQNETPGTWAGEGLDAEQWGSGDTSDGHINSSFSSMGWISLSSVTSDNEGPEWHKTRVLYIQAGCAAPDLKGYYCWALDLPKGNDRYFSLHPQKYRLNPWWSLHYQEECWMVEPA